jgi:peptidyl-prolyl cis-trans isomerase SurA
MGFLTSSRQDCHESALISAFHSSMVRAFREPTVMFAKIKPILCLLAVISAFGTLTLTGSGARSQDAVRIAAVVNDDAISLLDVYERTAIIFATTGLEHSQETERRIIPQVLRTLIDERLQLQEGARAGLDDVEVNFDQVYPLVEQNLGIQSGQLQAFMAYNNLNIESLNAQLTAEIVWSELVERRTQRKEITDRDIDAELDRLRAAADQPAYLLAEIFLAVDEPSKEPEIEANMLRLREAIQSGASFPIIARQFSQSASAIEGGDLGWIVEGQLSEDLLAVVPQLPVGELSQPIRVIGGFTMMLMREKRVGFAATPDDTNLTMRQVIFPVSLDETDASVSQRAALAGSALEACGDVDALGTADPTLVVGSEITIRLGDLQPTFRGAVTGLVAGEASAPVRTEQGFHVIVVCDLSEANNGLPSREEIQANLAAIQFDLVARGYLRDLRRSSFVDIRI